MRNNLNLRVIELAWIKSIQTINNPWYQPSEKVVYFSAIVDRYFKLFPNYQGPVFSDICFYGLSFTCSTNIFKDLVSILYEVRLYMRHYIKIYIFKKKMNAGS